MDDLLTIRVQGKSTLSHTHSEALLCEIGLSQQKNDRIIADTYTGNRSNYTRREKTEIRIIQNGADFFCGSFDELINILRAEKERKINQETY